MTEEEELVMSSLVEAWNAYLLLPKQHPDDVAEFRHSLHELQRLIAIRAVRRDYPAEWYNEEHSKLT
jgi:hypothetical protein